MRVCVCVFVCVCLCSVASKDLAIPDARLYGHQAKVFRQVPNVPCCLIQAWISKIQPTNLHISRLGCCTSPAPDGSTMLKGLHVDVYQDAAVSNERDLLFSRVLACSRFEESRFVRWSNHRSPCIVPAADVLPNNQPSDKSVKFLKKLPPGKSPNNEGNRAFALQQVLRADAGQIC